MLDTTYLQKIKKNLHSYALLRRDVINHSGDALHHAKRAIFSMHRGDLKEAKKKISDAERILKQLVKKHGKHAEMKMEGSYKAALEEYVEATLLYQFMTKKTIGKISSLGISEEVYLAGLCDVPGELYRLAIRAAANSNIDLVRASEAMASEIIGELIEFDLTKYLRTKFDQARMAHQKLEIVMYELSIRDKQ